MQSTQNLFPEARKHIDYTAVRRWLDYETTDMMSDLIRNVLHGDPVLPGSVWEFSEPQSVKVDLFRLPGYSMAAVLHEEEPLISIEPKHPVTQSGVDAHWIRARFGREVRDIITYKIVTPATNYNSQPEQFVTKYLIPSKTTLQRSKEETLTNF